MPELPPPLLLVLEACQAQQIAGKLGTSQSPKYGRAPPWRSEGPVPTVGGEHGRQEPRRALVLAEAAKAGQCSLKAVPIPRSGWNGGRASSVLPKVSAADACNPEPHVVSCPLHLVPRTVPGRVWDCSVAVTWVWHYPLLPPRGMSKPRWD